MTSYGELEQTFRPTLFIYMYVCVYICVCVCVCMCIHKTYVIMYYILLYILYIVYFIYILCTLAEELMLLNCGVEKTLESPLDCKEIQPVHPKGNQS